jgi:hypothetical protein
MTAYKMGSADIWSDAGTHESLRYISSLIWI